MEITDEHMERALALVKERWTPPDVVDAPPAYEGYLAAVERMDQSAGIAGPKYDVMSAYGAVWMEVGNGAPSIGRRYSPDEARALAYELLVGADLAEGSGGTER